MRADVAADDGVRALDGARLTSGAFEDGVRDFSPLALVLRRLGVLRVTLGVTVSPGQSLLQKRKPGAEPGRRQLLRRQGFGLRAYSCDIQVRKSVLVATIAHS